MKDTGDEIHDANAEMDDEANRQPVNHFDSEAIAAANHRLVEQAKLVKSALEADEVAKAPDDNGVEVAVRPGPGSRVSELGLLPELVRRHVDLGRVAGEQT